MFLDFTWYYFYFFIIIVIHYFQLHHCDTDFVLYNLFFITLHREYIHTGGGNQVPTAITGPVGTFPFADVSLGSLPLSRSGHRGSFLCDIFFLFLFSILLLCLSPGRLFSLGISFIGAGTNEASRLCTFHCRLGRGMGQRGGRGDGGCWLCQRVDHPHPLAGPERLVRPHDARFYELQNTGQSVPRSTAATASNSSVENLRRSRSSVERKGRRSFDHPLPIPLRSNPPPSCPTPRNMKL